MYILLVCINVLLMYCMCSNTLFISCRGDKGRGNVRVTIG